MWIYKAIKLQEMEITVFYYTIRILLIILYDMFVCVQDLTPSYIIY